jgi:8-oxo-dGTP pyrophosphatase MutT (NUDIX family)
MENKAGIYLVNNEGKVLMGKPSGHNDTFWSIPKGKMEEGETAWQTAMRETQEESNVDLKDIELDKIYELPKVKYTSGKKCIYPFVILECENDMDFSKLDIKCNAIVPADAKWNAGKPEFDEFKWGTFDEAEKMLHSSQQGSIKLVRDLYKKCNGNRKD